MKSIFVLNLLPPKSSIDWWIFACNNYDYSVCLVVTFYFPLSFYIYSLKSTVRESFPFSLFIYIRMDSIFILSYQLKSNTSIIYFAVKICKS